MRNVWTVPTMLIVSLLAIHSVQARSLTFNQHQQTANLEGYFHINGPQKTIEKYFDCIHGVGYDLVATGALATIKVAVELLPNSDACVTELLHSALADALVKNPYAVLPYINRSSLLSQNQVCVPLMIDVPKARALQELRRTERVLRSVNDVALRRNRDACLIVVSRSIKNIEASSPD